jgi:hypothetical protein
MEEGRPRRGRPPGVTYTEKVYTYLKPEQLEALKRIAEEKDKSLAATIREAIARLLEGGG